MPIDASIPLSVRPPQFPSAQDVVSLQALSAQTRRQQETDQRQNAARQLLAQPGAVGEDGLPTLKTIGQLYGADPDTAQRAAQLRIENAKNEEYRNLQRMQAMIAAGQYNALVGKSQIEANQRVYRTLISAYEASKEAGAPEEVRLQNARDAARKQFNLDYSSGAYYGADKDSLESEISNMDPFVAQGRLQAVDPQGTMAARKQAVEEKRAETQAKREERTEARDEEKLALDKAKLELEKWKAQNPTPGDKKVTPENAGKFASMKAARKDIDAARALVFDKDGNIRRSVLIQSAVPGTGGVGTEGRNLKSAIYNVADVILRMRTGAAANASEVQKLAETFSPSPLDTAASAKFKLDRLQDLFDEAIGIAEQSMPETKPQETKPPVKTTPKAIKTPATGPYPDAEKERRYQEWKKQQ